MICFQGKPFNITEIQVHVPTTNAEEDEVEWFYEDLLEKVSFHSNPKERQCQRMLKLLHNCTHLTR